MTKRNQWDDEWIAENFDNFKTIKKLWLQYNKSHKTQHSYDGFKHHCRVVLGYSKRKRTGGTEWHDEWIVENLYSYPSYAALAQAYNEKYGTDIKPNTIGTHVKHNLGIDKTRLTGEFLTEEQKAFIEEYYPTHSVKDTTEAFNKRFNTNKGKSTMLNYARRHNLTVNEDIVTKSKIDAAHGENSRFPYRKIGDARFDGGRWVIKTEEGWEQSGRAIWKKEHGDIPKGYAVIHLDGDCGNWDINNLMCVPVKYVGVLQGNNMRSSNSEITRTAVLWCELSELLELEEKSCPK